MILILAVSIFRTQNEEEVDPEVHLKDEDVIAPLQEFTSYERNNI